MICPNIGGIVNADAMAIISLRKNRPKDVIGNDFAYLVPNFWVKALSFAKLVTVLTTNVIPSFKIDGSIPLIETWSAKLEEIYVEVYTSSNHLNSNVFKNICGLVNRSFSPFPTPFHNGVLPLAFSITDLSTMVLKGETKKPEAKPANIYA